MARAVKGVYVLGIIKQLKIWQRENRADSIPNLDLTEDRYRQLFEGSIMSCGWYDLKSFWRVLESDFLLVYGGTPRGLKKMGIDSANLGASGPQKRP